jgi:hypothetical protein
MAKSDYPFHPLAEQYPLMGDAELAELADDIRENGLKVPVVLWRGQIIDGRNRYLACLRAGVECRYDDHAGPEEGLESHIASLNENRRHLTAEWLQRRRSERIERVARAHVNGESLRSIAAAQKVSHEQVRQDLKEATVKGLTVEPPDGRVKGRDGKSRPARQAEPPAKKVKAKPAPAATDALGAPLPDGLKDIFADPALDEAEALLSAWAEAVHPPAVLRPLIQRMTVYPFLHLDRLSQALRQVEDELASAIKMVRVARPHAVCAGCGGKGCLPCRHAGYVPAWAITGEAGS